MNYVGELALETGLDLNGENQTVGLLRAFAPKCRAPRHAHTCTTHGLPATEHLSTLRGRRLREAQGQGLLVSGPVLR